MFDDVALDLAAWMECRTQAVEAWCNRLPRNQARIALVCDDGAMSRPYAFSEIQVLAALDALGIAIPADLPGLDDPDSRQVILEAFLHRSVRESMHHHLSAGSTEQFNRRREHLQYGAEGWSEDYFLAASAESLDLLDRLKLVSKYGFATGGYQRIEQADIPGEEGGSELHAHLAWLGACMAFNVLGLLSQPWNAKSQEQYQRVEHILALVKERGGEVQQLYREHWRPVQHRHRFEMDGLQIADSDLADRLAEVCGATDDECDTCREPALALLAQDGDAVADLFVIIAGIWERHPRQLAALEQAGSAWAYLLGPGFDPAKARAAIDGMSDTNRYAMADFATRMLCLGMSLDASEG